MANFTDLKLHVPSTILISGPSQCGKTTLIESLLTEPDCFNHQFNEICWVHAPHAENKALFERLKGALPIKFREGYPDKDITDNTLFKRPNRPNLLVLDDILVNPSTPYKSLYNLFNIFSHHQNITVILTVQNLAGATPSQKSCLSTLLRSCSYLVLFASRRMTPVFRFIATGYFPGEQYRVLKPFKEALSLNNPHSYFVYDFVTENEQIRIRNGGLVPSHKCYIYKHEEDGSGETTEDGEKRQSQGSKDSEKVELG
jgi:hypothetical protein